MAVMSSSPNNSSGPLGTDEVGLSTGVVYLLISSLILATNALVIPVLANTKMLQAPTFVVLTNMAFWNFMQGLNVLIFAMPSAFLKQFAYSKAVIGYSACISSFLVGLTAFNTASAVLDRFISVMYPLQYRKLTTRHAGTAVLVLITLAGVRMCLIAFPDADFYFNTEAYLQVSNLNTLQGTLASVVSISLAFGTIIILSISILINIKRRNRRVHALGSVCGISRRTVRVSLMVLASSAVFCISYVPLMICILINYIYELEKRPRELIKFAVVCVMSNSIWNVLIYTIQSKDFRNTLIRIFCKSYYLNQKRRRQISNGPAKKVFVVSKQLAATTSC